MSLLPMWGVRSSSPWMAPHPSKAESPLSVSENWARWHCCCGLKGTWFPNSIRHLNSTVPREWQSEGGNLVMVFRRWARQEVPRSLQTCSWKVILNRAGLNPSQPRAQALLPGLLCDSAPNPAPHLVPATFITGQINRSSRILQLNLQN